MKPKRIYKVGEQIGDCIFLRETKFDFPRRAIFKCKCGNEFEVFISSIKLGQSLGCGCRRGNPTHEQTRINQSVEYSSWSQMKERCYNIKNKNYLRYGGRGVIVCDRWLYSFDKFLEDMGKKPSLKHTIDRINNDGNYDPTNCRWATILEQARNKSTNVMILFNGETKCLSAWAERFNINTSTLWNRLHKKWPIEKALIA